MKLIIPIIMCILLMGCGKVRKEIRDGNSIPCVSPE